MEMSAQAPGEPRAGCLLGKSSGHEGTWTARGAGQGTSAGSHGGLARSGMFLFSDKKPKILRSRGRNGGCRSWLVVGRVGLESGPSDTQAWKSSSGPWSVVKTKRQVPGLAPD